MRRYPVVVLLFALSASLFSQSDRGTITGTIADSSGGAIASAAVQARNIDSGAMYPVASSATGNYTIGELPEGNYELTVTAPGFKRYVRGGLTVQVAQTIRIDVALEVGNASESVTVTAESPLLKTESGELSQNIATERMDNLPLLPTGAAAGNSGIRNPYAVIALLPGSFYAGTGTAANNSTVQINGAPVNTETILVEGMDATNPIGQGLVQFNQPGADAIQEWSVQTSNYAAEFGQSGGGIMNVTMKSGTNQFHGTAYEYLVNEIFNGGQPFTNNGNGQLIRPETRRNDFGGTVGGPVWIPKVYNGRNKTFFFFSFEQYRLGQTVIPTPISVPTAAYRDGNFSAALLNTNLGTDPLGRPILGNEIYDPASVRTVNGQQVTDPFPNNTIPQSRFDPVAVAIQNLIPAPTNPGLLANNYQNSFRSTTTTTVPSIKGDELISSKDKISFYWSKIRNQEPVAVGANGLPEPISTDIGTDIRGNTTRLSYDRIISPTLLLHMGAGFMQSNLGQPLESTYNPAQIGLVGPFSQPSAFPYMLGMANAQGGLGAATVGTTAGIGLGAGAHSYSIDSQPTAIASITWVKNNHTFKFGASMLIQGDAVEGFSTLNGTYTFSNLQTALPYVALSSATGSVGGNTIGFPYASFLLGLVASGNVHEPSDVRLGRSQWAGYAQDTWKVTRKFTLDYGLRYDYSTYLKEQYGRAPNFSPTLANPNAGGIPGATIYEATCKCDFAHNYPWAFGPRLGAAYQVTPKTVARAGFGIAYSGTPLYGSGGGAGTASNPFGPSANPFEPSMVLSQGVPLTAQQIAWPNLSPGQFPQGGALVGAGPPSVIDQNAGRPARNYQWSLGVQREINANLMVEAAYVGTRGIWWATSGSSSSTSQLVNYNYLSPQILGSYGLSLNNPADLAILAAPLGSAAAGPFQDKLPYAGFPLTATVAQSLRPFPQFNSGLTPTWAPLGDTWYNSLQAKATQRFSHGLSATFAFTWSKNLDNMEGSVMPTDVGNRQTAVTLDALDRPLVSSWAFNYTVPTILATSKSTGYRAASWVARDWQISGFFQYSSGALIPPPAASSTPSLSNLIFQNTVMDRVPGQPLFLQNLNCNCFNPSTTFVLNPAAWVNPPAGQFGTATFYSDYRYQRRPVENLALGRLFRIHEAISLNLRIEFTNLFNRTEVNNPVSANPLQAQTRVNSNPNSQTAAGFGYINTLGTTFAAPRQGQIVARFTF